MKRYRWLIAAALVLGIGLLFWLAGPSKPVDMTAAMSANNRGLARMEMFEYALAEKEFAEAFALAPDYLPVQINLRIAQLNVATADSLAAGRAGLMELRSKHPDEPHIHFCLGIIDEYENRIPEAHAHFARVLEIDPTDPHTLYHLGYTHPDREGQAAADLFRKALTISPYYNAARYQLALHPLTGPDDKRDLLQAFRAFESASWVLESKIVYLSMGKYADCIGRVPDSRRKGPASPMPMFPKDDLKVVLAPGARWATDADLGADDVGNLRRKARETFGAAMLTLDYDGDELPDLYLAAAVVDESGLRDLLLRNIGDGSFTDVTKACGLPTGRASLVAIARDADNDGFPDLLLLTHDGVKMFRNVKATKTFEDATASAGLAGYRGVYLSAAFVDLDQDWDLDLLLCRFAETPAEATKLLGGEAKSGAGSRLLTLLSVGESPAVPRDKPYAPLQLKYRLLETPALLAQQGSFSGIVLADLDGDQDVDILLLSGEIKPVSILNDRLLRFHLGTMGESWTPAISGTAFAGGSATRSDLLLGGKRATQWLTANGDSPESPFEPVGWPDSALRQIHGLDADLDGTRELVGLTPTGGVALFRKDIERKLATVPDWLGAGDLAPGGVLAFVPIAVRADNLPGLMLWKPDGLEYRRNLGNGNHCLKLRIAGIRSDGDGSRRSNTDAVGAWVYAYAGGLTTAIENATLSASPGQSSGPLYIGIGKATQTDFVRVRWPDLVPQAELNVPADRFVRIDEDDRRSTSCPVVFTWDGEKWVYVTDFLGAGAMGELGSDGTARPPRPVEALKIESHQLKPVGGKLRIRIGEPMDEVMYLDRVRLEVLDHPSASEVYPDERFATADPQPTGKPIAFDKLLPAKSARNHRGVDLTAILKDRDDRYHEEFARRAWLGFAEDHWIELDFSEAIRGLAPDAPLWLVMSGWTDYAYPESIFAAEQAGIAMKTPWLEAEQTDGTWKKVGEPGFPAGLPRTMLSEITGWLKGSTGRVRWHSNLRIYFDQIRLGIPAKTPATSTMLELSTAVLSSPGYAREYRRPGDLFARYDAERTEKVVVSRWQGSRTRLGDVRELLTAEDDRFAIAGPGDEIALEFDIRDLPAPPAGTTRSYLLHGRGYSRDTGPFTLFGGKIEPLPFAAMGNVPASPDAQKHADAARAEYVRKWNTRGR